MRKVVLPFLMRGRERVAFELARLELGARRIINIVRGGEADVTADEAQEQGKRLNKLDELIVAIEARVI